MRKNSFVIYGRRRVGKTALINEFCRNKKALLFLATEENERENRETKDSNIMLIVCGSLINMMTTQVLSYDSPLYRRRSEIFKGFVRA